MKIYTKTGDEGETGLLGGERVAKDSLRIAAIGDIDELNAYFGVCQAIGMDEEISAKLLSIQNLLFEIGSELACPLDGKFQIASVTAEDIARLESELDEMDAELAPLKQFILPGGAPLAANLHYLRTVCRRTERSILALHRVFPVRSELIIYMNRLSDWIFCSSRLSNHRSGVEEQKWSKRENK